MSGLTAVDGVSFSTLTAINGQTLAVIGVPGVASDIIFADAVEHNTAGDDKWLNTGSNPTISSGVTDAHGRVYDLSVNPISLAIGQNLTDFAIGARFRFQTDATQQIILSRDGTLSTNNQIIVSYVAGGSISISRNATQLDITAGSTVSLNAWYYIEVGATIDNTTGSVTCKIYNDSGTLLDTLSFSGDTQNTANSFISHVFIAGANNDAYADDLWIADSTTLYGPLRVENLYPDGDGALTQWAVHAGSGADWELVDEAQNNDATDDLVETSTNLISLFTFQDRALTGAIHAVQVTPVVSRAAAVGGVQFRVVARIGGVNYNGTTLTLGQSGYHARPYCFSTNPATGLAWNSSEVASAEFGVESIATPVDIFLTQIVLELVTAV